MIKNVFLPEKIGSYYFFPQRIVGLDIGKTQVTATQVYCKGKQRTIEKVVTEVLPATGTYQERASAALQALVGRLDSYDALYSSFPASMTFFKELTVPFTTREQISLMYEYEVAPLLPFSLDNAVTDFIITASDPATNSAQILVAAVQKQHLAELLAMFDGAGITPDRVIVDVFALYSLYKELPSAHVEQENMVLVNLGVSSSRIAFMVNGQLKFVRALPQGIAALAKALAQELDLSPADAHEQLMRFGFEQTDAHRIAALSKILSNYADQLSFTLESFAQKTESRRTNKIIVTGGGAQIRGIAFALERHLHIPVALFPVQEIASLSHVHIKDPEMVTEQAVMSISIALPTPTIEGTTLRTKEFSVSDESLFLKQIGTSVALIALTLGLLIGNNIWQQRKLNQALTKAQKELVTTLTEAPNLGVTASNAAEALEEAKSKVDEQERIWFAFTSRTRSSFLMYLQKLSTAIDKDSLRLSLKKLSMTHDTIRLEGEVKDIPALITLEEELHATGLGFFTSPQEPKFDITISLKKEGVGNEAA